MQSLTATVQVHLILGPQIKPNWMLTMPAVIITIKGVLSPTLETQKSIRASIAHGTVKTVEAYNHTFGGKFYWHFPLDREKQARAMARENDRRKALTDNQLLAEAQSIRLKQWFPTEAAQEDGALLLMVETLVQDFRGPR